MGETPSSHDAPTSAATGVGPTLDPPGAPKRPPFRPPGPPIEGPGDQIGPYKLLSVLGEGGFGMVYLAERREPHVQRVALKVIKPGMDSRAVIARFEAERQALAIMDHPNVARVFDAGTTPTGRPYFVMEYVQGEPITTYCDKQTLATRGRLAIFIDVCEAVQHAHHKGIIHRDIKPSNILVTVKDGAAIPKVIDFGVAKAISRQLTEKSIFTEIGQLIGTPEYMSPEQAEMGTGDIDTRTDVYSLGVVLYELLTGAVPFDSRTLRSAGLDEIRRIIREIEPPRPSTRLSSLGDTGAAVAQRRQTQLAALARELRSELEWIPLKALRKDRTQRYRTPLELADDIRNYLAGRPLIAGPESAAYRARKFLRRNRAPAVAAAAVLAALVLGLAGTLWQAALARHERDQARAQEKRANDAAAESDAKTDFLMSALQSGGTVGGDGPSVTVATVIDRTAPRVDEQFAAQPLVRLRLHEMYGRVYRSLSLHAKADEHIRAALKVARETLKPDDEQVTDLLSLLTTIQLERGKDLEALKLCRELLAEAPQAAAPGTAPADAATRANGQLASVYWNAGDYEVAEYRLRQALAAADPTGRAAAYREGDIGRLLVDEGFPAEAEPHAVKSLEMRRRLDGEPSMSVAFGMLTLGYVRQAAGDPAGAAVQYRSARSMYMHKLEDSEKTLVAMARMDLAGLVEDAAPNAAWPAPDDTNPAFEAKQLGDMEWISAISLRNRGRILYAQGRSADGDDRFRRSIQLDQSLDAATTGQGQPRQRQLSEAHTHRVWADLMRRPTASGAVADRQDAAEREYRSALALSVPVATGDDQLLTVPTLLGLGELSLEKGRPEEARGHLAEAVRLRRSALGDDAWPTATAVVAWSKAMTALGKQAEAEPQLLTAVKAIETALGPSDRRTLAARAAAAAMYQSWGKPDKARESKTP